MNEDDLVAALDHDAGFERVGSGAVPEWAQDRLSEEEPRAPDAGPLQVNA